MNPAHWRRAGVLALVAAVIAAGVLLRDELSRAALERHIAALGVWAPLAFIAAYALGAVAFVPGSIFTIAGGALFGPLLGTLYSLIGATAGAALAFLAARHGAADWTERISGPRLARLRRGIDREGWRFVAFVRLVPLFPFNLLNYALGLTRIALGPYSAATFICMAPGTLAFAWLGHAGAEAITGARGAVESGLVALALLAAAIFLPRLVRRIRGEPGGTS